MPSSLNLLLPIALDFSSNPPESVCGTVRLPAITSVFSQAEAYLIVSRLLGKLFITTRLNVLTDFPTKTALWFERKHLHASPDLSNSVHPLCLCPDNPVVEYQRLILRATVDTSTLALGPTNPKPNNVASETLGIRRSEFSSDLRYLYRHSHFRKLHRTLRYDFAVFGTLPYRTFSACA